MKKIVATLAIAAAIFAAAVHAQQVRDQSQAPRAGTAGISGIVTSDEQTPQPLRRVSVTVVNQSAGLVRSTFTNEAGRFSFSGLPAGSYQLSASKAPYLRMSYGAKRPEASGTSITLANAAQMTDISMRLPKGSIISGRITDENGEPAFGVGVRVMQARMQNGERTLVQPVVGTTNDMTDDRGVFRLFGLTPGEYIVIANPRATSGEIRAMTEGEIRAVMQELQQQQAARTQAQQQQSGVVGYGAPAPTPTPSPKPNVEKVTVAYAPVYYPGTTVASTAMTVSVGTGEERSGLDFALRLVRTAKVEGQVIVPDGIAPQNVTLMMMPATPAGVGGPLPLTMAATEILAQQSVAPGPDGKFAYNAVAPGTYLIAARAVRPAGGGPGAPPPPPPPVMGVGGGGGGMVMTRTVTVNGGDVGDIVFNGARLGGAADPNAVTYWAQVEVPVDGMPVSGVTLTLQPGMTITGRVEFRSSLTRPGADFKNVSLNLQPVASGGGPRLQIGQPGVKIDEKGEFTITGVVPGRYRISGNVGGGGNQGPSAGPPWRLGSAIVKNADVLDFPFDVAPSENISGAVVTFTDATQSLTGQLQDSSGRPSSDYTIIVFPADKAMWSVARRIKTARPATDGKFSMLNMPAGEYMMAAVTDLMPNEQNDPAFLEQVLRAAFKIMIAPGEQKVQDLKISGGL